MERNTHHPSVSLVRCYSRVSNFTLIIHRLSTNTHHQPVQRAQSSVWIFGQCFFFISSFLRAFNNHHHQNGFQFYKTPVSNFVFFFFFASAFFYLLNPCRTCQPHHSVFKVTNNNKFNAILIFILNSSKFHLNSS